MRERWPFKADRRFAVNRFWEQSDCLRCQAGGRVAHKVHSLWIGLRIPAVDLWTTPVCFMRGLGMAASTGVIWNHGVEDREHLAQHGDQRRLWLNAAAEQALIIRAQRRVTAHRTERGHVQHLTNTRTAAGNMSSAVPLATIVIIGSHADQGNLRAVNSTARTATCSRNH